MVEKLINSNFECSEKLIRKEIFEKKERTAFLKDLPCLKAFSKYIYFTHIGADEDYFHSVEHGLYGQLLIDEPRKDACEDCKKPFQFFRNVKPRIYSSNGSAHSSLGNCMKRIRLYMGHEQRRYAKDRRITEVFNKMKKSEAGT